MKALIVGAGQIGSRHLQALASLDAVQEVHVVEPHEVALQTAIARWQQIAGHTDKTIQAGMVADCPFVPDFAIIATPSTNRLAVLRDVLARGAKQLLCEKVLFQSVAEYREAIRLCTAHAATLHVNHIYRYVPLYQHIRAQAQHEDLTIEIDYRAGSIGMGCIFVHVLDMFKFMTGQALSDFTVEIDKSLIPCKRGEAFIEFNGTAQARTARGDVLQASYGGDAAALPVINIRYGTQHVVVDEGADSWRDMQTGEVHPLQMPMTSKLTAQLVPEILQGKSLLPTLEESFALNALMLNAYNQSLYGTYDDTTRCAIT